MSHSAAPSQGKDNYSATQELWEQDPALQPRLHAIVAETAALGTGARFVTTTPQSTPRVLVGVRGNRHPWRAPALAAVERGDVVADADTGVLAAPVFGPAGIRAALLLYHDPGRRIDGGERLVGAYAAHIETVLALLTSRADEMTRTVDALFQALAAHDELTARHSRVVRRLTRLLGQAMGIAGHDLLEWEWAAMLHDVGKISVPQQLLRSARPLTGDEWTAIRRHPADGERIVRSIPALHTVGFAIRHHHERWDGAGYPDRLSGAAIPLVARVITLVDSYETMRAGRPYRAPLAFEDAINELRRGAGTQFDPQLLVWLPALTGHDIDI